MTAQDQITAPSIYRLKVADYLALDETGAFRGLRTELIEGEVFVLSPQYRRHAFVKDELTYRLRRALEAIGSALHPASETSVDMTERDMPQPDITLTSEPRGDGPVPLPSVALIVEVADSSLAFDLERKVQLYARNDVAEYWVVDVNGRVIHQMWAPVGEAYGQRLEVAFGAVLAAVTVAGLRVETDGLAQGTGLSPQPSSR